MQRRRMLLTLNVAFNTPVEQLERIPGVLRQIVEKQAQVTFERAHFKQIGDCAQIFECVYYVEGDDFQYYMDVLQAINLEIKRRFEAEGIQLTPVCIESGTRTSADVRGQRG
jgi:small-conductance mechanosensitive channel